MLAVVLASLVSAERAAKAGFGYSTLELKNKINTRYVLEILEKRAVRK
jgi:hypothetical protein